MNTITGSSVWYGGGGGGGCYAITSNYTSYSGGTGNQSGYGTGFTTNAHGQSGSPSVGAGGGGGHTNNGYSGGDGSNGVVILAWLTGTASITVGAGLTADTTGTNGLYSYKRFTAGTGTVTFA